MALIKNNARVVCLVALMVMSTSFFSCDASRSLDIGLENEWDIFCLRLPGCHDPKPSNLTLRACQLDCKDNDYDPAKSECKAGACCCHK
uniref:Uncharacterized protein n=1 Tax=Avena sativa TaxID=4498 RepID=A0ACD5TF36_AVESA